MKPLISVIIPHLPGRELLSIESINRQTVKELEVFIEWDFCQKGAPRCRNLGAEKSCGEYLFFCDDDLELADNCLEKMLNALQENPAVSFAYCDYAKEGEQQGIEKGLPWSLEKLFERNYISTMSLVRRADFVKFKFDESLKRYQDWDLWLRMGKAGHSGIYIPESLFTAWYYGPGISSGGRKDRLRNTLLLKYKHGIKYKKHSIIIPVKNQFKLVRLCINSVLSFSGGMFEIIVVDDGSTEIELLDYLNHLSENKKIKLLQGPGLGHTAACNLGVRESTGDVIFLLNSDTVVTRGWNVVLSETLDNPGVSAVGPMTSYAASPQQINWIAKRRWQYKQYRDVNDFAKAVEKKYGNKFFIGKITGFCMGIKRSVWDLIGPLDEQFPAAGNEADWLIRGMKTGLYPLIKTDVFILHYGRASYIKNAESDEI